MKLSSFFILFAYLICILVEQSAMSYVYNVQHLYNHDLDSHVILLSDYHEENKISTAQRLAILQAAKDYRAYLLVEDQGFLYQDISSQNIIAYQPCLQPLIDDIIADPVHFYANKHYNQDFSILDPETEGDSTPLYLLTHMARQEGINASTVECRQAEVISSHGGPICAADVCLAYDKAVQDTEKYDDGELYNQYYKNKVDTYMANQALAYNFFEYLRSYKGNLEKAYANRPFEQEVMKCYCHIHQQEMAAYYQDQGLSFEQAQEKTSSKSTTIAADEDIYEKIMRSLYLFLIDTRIIHEIAQNEYLPAIMVYAGGAHIDEVATVLRANGYDLVDQFGNAHNEPVDLDAYFEDLAVNLPAQITHSNNYWLTLLEMSYTTSCFCPLNNYYDTCELP